MENRVREKEREREQLATREYLSENSRSKISREGGPPPPFTTMLLMKHVIRIGLPETE